MLRMPLYALLIIIFWFSPLSQIQAQTELVYAEATASVDGIVRDAMSGELLPGAHIQLGEGYRGTASGPSGDFSFQQLKPGTYTLICSFIGYRQENISVSLQPEENEMIYIELQPTEARMEEVVVKSSAKKKIAEIGLARIDNEMISRLPSAFEADLFRSLQHLPGIKSSSDFSSGLHIRGGSPDQTLILLDETPVYNPSHFFGFYSTFNPDAVEGVQLYKGNYPARYGGRLGSVLETRNRNGNRDDFGMRMTMGVLASRVSAGGPHSWGTWMLSVRRSTLEPMLAVLRDQVEQIPHNFYFYDVNGRITIDSSPKDKFSFSIYSGRDQVNFPLAVQAELGLSYGNQMAAGTWTHLYSDKVFSKVTASASGFYNRPVNSIADTRQGTHNHIRDYSFEHELHYLSHTGHQLETGIDVGMLDLGFENWLNGESTFESKTRSLYGAWYLQHRWEAGERWVLTSGLRVNGFEMSDYLKVNPRISVQYQLIPEVKLQAAYGQYDQFLSQTSQQTSGFNLWLSSGKGVQPSSGKQLQFGIKSLPFQNHSLNVEAYYRTMENMFELDPFLPDMAGLAYDELFRYGQGHAYGVEVMIERHTGRLNGYLGYNWSISQRRFPDVNQGQFYAASHNREHEFNVVLYFKMAENWTATAAFNYATGQPYTKPAGYRLRTESIPSYGNTVVLVVNEINGARLPAYHRVDFAITRYGSLLGLVDSKISFQLVNAYSRRNVWHLQHNVYRGKIQSKTAYMLPVLPALTYTVNF